MVDRPFTLAVEQDDIWVWPAGGTGSENTYIRYEINSSRIPRGEIRKLPTGISTRPPRAATHMAGRAVAATKNNADDRPTVVSNVPIRLRGTGDRHPQYVSIFRG